MILSIDQTTVLHTFLFQHKNYNHKTKNCIFYLMILNTDDMKPNEVLLVYTSEV